MRRIWLRFQHGIRKKQAILYRSKLTITTFRKGNEMTTIKELLGLTNSIGSPTLTLCIQIAILLALLWKSLSWAFSDEKSRKLASAIARSFAPIKAFLGTSLRWPPRVQRRFRKIDRWVDRIIFSAVTALLLFETGLFAALIFLFHAKVASLQLIALVAAFFVLVLTLRMMAIGTLKAWRPLQARGSASLPSKP
jgi:hypothetical protein